MRLARPLLAFVVGACSPAIATSVSAQSAEEQPTVIESQKLDMKSSDTETISIFTGTVVVTGTNMRLTCDRLEVVALRQADASATIGKIERFKSLVAEGNVRIIQGDREAACGKAFVLPGEDRVVLQQKPVLVDHVANWTGTGDEVILHRGDRRVTGTNFRFVGPALKDLGVDREKLLQPESPPETPKQP